ncbi:MAG TPA: hypothetical protein VGU20_00095 [Stellaceae bacterium]|nr:hypothetical protein [Stellaceae bacterium]
MTKRLSTSPTAIVRRRQHRTELLIAKVLPPTPELEPNSQLVVFDIVTVRG